ncbi:MAG TPA: hypothetical protein VG742_15950 [Dongiaceae bacterium]|nr:hypothetical protein [Dongiaceae bacterium]
MTNIARNGRRTAMAAARRAATLQDTDLDTLKAAASSVMKIDQRYRRANVNDKIALKPERDRAFTAYSLARLKLLEDGVLTTAADLKKMQALKAEIDAAAAMQDLIIAAARVAAFLAKLALK